jgi:hypothetical protein
VEAYSAEWLTSGDIPEGLLAALRWADKHDFEREQLLLEGFARLRKSIKRYYKRRRDYLKQEYVSILNQVRWMIYAEVFAQARQITLAIHATGKGVIHQNLPVADARLMLQMLFNNLTLILLTTAETLEATSLSDLDIAYRTFIVNDRLKTFAVNYISDRGWNDDFLTTFTAYQQLVFEKARRTPGGQPMPD